MPTLCVVSSDAKGLNRRITVDDGKGGRVVIALYRFALVGKGDALFIDPEHPSRISVVSSENPNDRIRVTPHFEKRDSLRIGDASYPLKLTEIVSQQDADSFRFLEAFHYKTSTAVDDSEDCTSLGVSTTGGRKGVLLCYLQNGLRWEPVGYIELQMPLLMVGPRRDLFNVPFSHPNRPIQWERWDQYAIREYVNCIVRIARVVTSPEFRGLGLSKVLIRAAKEFAKERWHIKGRRPLFIEISAEMLRYIDFVSSLGCVYAGETEGNLDRVHDDLLSMQNNYSVSSGIMSLQKKYLVRLQKGCEVLGKTMEEMLSLVRDVAANPSLIASLSPGDYYYVKSVLRFRIPYFVGGLDEPSETYLRNNPNRKDRSPTVDSFAIKPGRLVMRQLSIHTRFPLPRTPHVRAIVDCFGLRGDELTGKVLDALSIEATGGNIVFVAGPSGSGKSLLLQALDPAQASPFVEITVRSQEDSRYTVGWIRELPSDTPLIEYFASRWGMERALAALNQTGLSEAYVYLKPYSLLSRGQRYRAMLADLALRSEQVWLIDEFCADLDPITARIVAANLRKHVIKYQRIAFVAAANHDHFLDALRPTRIIRLRHGFAPEQFTYKEYIDEFRAQR